MDKAACMAAEGQTALITNVWWCARRGARFPAGCLIVGCPVARVHVAVAAHVLGAVGARVDGGVGVDDAGQRGVQNLRRRLRNMWAACQAQRGQLYPCVYVRDTLRVVRVPLEPEPRSRGCVHRGTDKARTRIAIDVAALPPTAARTIGAAAAGAPAKQSRHIASSAGTAAALLLLPVLIACRHPARAGNVLAECLELGASPHAGREPRGCLPEWPVWLAC